MTAVRYACLLLTLGAATFGSGCGSEGTEDTDDGGTASETNRYCYDPPRARDAPVEISAIFFDGQVLRGSPTGSPVTGKRTVSGTFVDFDVTYSANEITTYQLSIDSCETLGDCSTPALSTFVVWLPRWFPLSFGNCLSDYYSGEVTVVVGDDGARALYAVFDDDTDVNYRTQLLVARGYQFKEPGLPGGVDISAWGDPCTSGCQPYSLQIDDVRLLPFGMQNTKYGASINLTSFGCDGKPPIVQYVLLRDFCDF